MSQAELIAEYTEMMNQFGPDSERCHQFLDIHSDDKELMSLCETAYWLKIALSKRPTTDN